MPDDTLENYLKRAETVTYNEPAITPMDNYHEASSIYQAEKIDNFTFAFDTNLAITGLTFDDLFKEVSEIELLNKKLLGVDAYSSVHNNDVNELKFETIKEARKYLFI